MAVQFFERIRFILNIVTEIVSIIMAFVTAIPVKVHNSSTCLRVAECSESLQKSPKKRFVTEAKQWVNHETKQWITPEAKPEPREPGVPTGRSSIFFNFMKSKTVRDFGGPTKELKSKGTVQDTLNVASTPFFLGFAKEYQAGYGSGGDARVKLHKPFIRRVDEYIAECARRQYIAAQNNSGVYSPTCTESTVSGGAEEARVASLAASFRRRQVLGVQSYTDYYETRRFATALSNGCNYEENLVGRFPAAAAMTILGTLEKEGVCSRYATPLNKAESYMSECVERAASARATQYGVYGILCSDGTTKGAAESKRVSCLASKYRNGFMNPLVKIQIKYNQSKFARDYYSHGCSYEDRLFSNYSAVAASMRPTTARY